ncbi:hypothetical protein ACTFIW_001986 [Dictyostelium discoideum]
MNNEPICTSLKDARVCIGIIGNINVTSEQITLGNYCGALWITSENINTENNNYTIIDGSSSTQPFLTCEPEEENNQTQSCSVIHVSIYEFHKLGYTDCLCGQSNFRKFRETIKFNIFRQLIVFTNSKVFNIKPSTILSPNSSTDFISPIYVMGGTITFNLSLLENSSITIKNSSGKTFGIANYFINKFNPNISVHFSLQDAVGGQSNMFPVIGNNSDVNLSEKSTKLNNIYCGCGECKYFLIYGYQFIPIANHTCIDPTPTPTSTTSAATTSITSALTTSTTTTSTTTTSTTSLSSTSTTTTSPIYNIKVNYNVERNYNSFEECGVDNQPVCTSLEDASNRAILLSKTGTSNNSIVINSDINGSTPVSLGNLYNYCGALYIKSSSDTVYINIDGWNSTQQPFLNIEEPDQPNSTYSCTSQRYFHLQNINFINWDQTIAKININQETNLTSTNNSKSFALYFNRVNIYSSSSILMVYPKNLGQIYNARFTTVYFITTLGYNLKSSSSLFAPGSVTDYVPPVYVVGGFINRCMNIDNGTFLSTPFIFVQGGEINIPIQTISNNNFSVNPFILSISSLVTLKRLVFKNNQLSTFICLYDCNGATLFNFEYENTTQTPFYQRNKYLGLEYEDSFAVIKKSHVEIKDCLQSTLSLNSIENFLVFVENSSLSFEFMAISSLISPNYFLKTESSSVSLTGLDLSNSDTPIIGSNSSIFFFGHITFTNKSLCGCQNCSYYLGKTIHDTTNYICSSNPTDTPTDQPTENPSTETPSQKPTQTSAPTPKSSRSRNISIIISILGIASIACLIIFSFIYKRHKNNKYISNSQLHNHDKISSNDSILNDSPCIAVADEDEKAVSPTIDISVVAYEQEYEDFAQLERL